MKTLKLTLIALLGLSLATVSCKKEAAPEQQQQTNNNGGNGTGNGSGNSTDTTNNNSNDSIITFVDLVDNVSSDSTIVYDSTIALSNTIYFSHFTYTDYSAVDIYTSNNGGMTNNELMTGGVYDDKLSGIHIYNEATSSWEDYTLVSSASHGLIINYSNGYTVSLAGTFVNANGDNVVIPWVDLKVQ